ncbi:hypothetical protein LEL_09036 [Akanthomyces lecanii RCEF 1005]|uniref:ubiquitinyl hydrolase 1 n=1 Tax=Akanthomyces lecanii RCEF 1005 TaxID=1081108 RepID=A0A168CUB5_CORDF|nr:hypothetical protein LEL_09036 [Akanthomyces lecanii RCEF 1005]
MKTPYIDPRNFSILVQDTFLLPKLPEENNDAPFVQDLPKLLIFALEKAQMLLSADSKTSTRNWPRIVHNFIDARSNGKISEESLLKLLNEENPEPIPLYLPHHNAGVIIHWADRRIEAFQLSPRVQAVIATTGRLRRKFPEISVAIDEDTASQEGFLQVLAETFAELDKCEVAGVKPNRNTKGKTTEQIFDATLPNHIFDPFFAWLFSEQSTSTDAHEDKSIVKNTRDYVLVTETETATIRRSPVWLLFKVVLQQELCAHGPSPDHTVYKQFMLVFFSSLIRVACDRGLDSDMIQLMRRKIGHRTMKLEAKFHDEGAGQLMGYVHAAVEKADTLLRSRLDALVQHERDKIPKRITPFYFDAAMGKVKLPDLDSFLSKAHKGKLSAPKPVCDPKSDTQVWDQDKMPNVQKIKGGSAAENIHDYILVEYWVEDYLDSYIEKHETDSLCSSIRTFAVNYFERVSVAYKNHPYHLSVMILTLLELWVACDKVAVRRNPLLSEYAPLGIENVNWDGLLLRTAKDRRRLGQAEDYIAKRASSKTSMIAEYGGPGCFASRFAQESALHHDLMVRMKTSAEKDEQKKAAELNKEKKRQKMLLDNHASTHCDPTVCTVGTSNLLCTRCNNLAAAREIQIRPYYKLLPDATDAAHALVFELQVPGDVAAWRDFCFFLQLDVAGHEIERNVQVNQSYLKNCEPYVQYYKAYGLETNSRICLASKPVLEGAGPKPVQQNTTVEELIKPCRMKWTLFDCVEHKFLGTVRAGWAIADMCRMKLDDQNHILQKFLEMDAEKGMNPNELIPLRDEEKDTSRIKHNEELASLCFGNNVTWPKILHSLRGSSIDWKASETFLFISQAVLQASPGNGRDNLRQRHAQLGDASFAEKLLSEVERQLQFYTTSFSGRVAIAVFCTIAIKFIADGPNMSQKQEYTILSRSREACFRWMQQIRPLVHDSTSEMHETQLELALIYVHTLNLDNGRLKPILRDITVAEGYVLASTIIQESKSYIATTFQRSLYSSWLRLAVNASQILGGLVRDGNGYGISNGVYYSLGQPLSLRFAAERCEMVAGSWMKTHLILLDGTIGQTIHFNLMSAELLIDGKSPRHLSDTFTEHADFIALFGSLGPAVTPTADPRYEYRFKQPFKGFTIEVGLEMITSDQDNERRDYDLHVRASKDGTVHVLIPRRVLSGPQFQFPSRYLDEYLHWSTLGQTRDEVDFYSTQDPWDCCSLSWRLNEEEGGWLLKDHKQDRIVLPIELEYHQRFFKMFKYFITEKDFTVILNAKKRNLEIHLRSLALNFFVPDGSSAIHSVEHENMCVSHDYRPDTLLGCRSTLVLYNQLNTSSRIVLVPDGEVEYSRSKSHMRVQVGIKADTMVHVYQVDKLLRQLKPDHTWRSKAYLAYLSALTSYCMPDPFTGKTGQETALDILQSGALTSFFALSVEDYDLVNKISKLAPERKLAKKSRGSLPMIEWDPNLRVASHHECYWFAAQKILETAEISEIFKRTSTMERRIHPESVKKLRVADAARFACFRTQGYGAEQSSDDAVYYFRMPTTKKELKESKGQMKYCQSDGFRRSYFASLGAKQCQLFNSGVPATSDIWGSVAKGGIIKGATKHYDAEKLRYSAGLLGKEENTLEADFCSVHEALSRLRENLNPYRVRLWLATVASGMSKESATNLVPVLSAIWLGKVPSSVEIPTSTNTGANVGSEVNKDKIIEALEGAKREFNSDKMDIDDSDGEDEEGEEDQEDEEDGKESAENMFLREQDEAIEALAKQIGEKSSMNLTEYSSYLHVKRAEDAIKNLIKNVRLNRIYTDYFEHLSAAAGVLPQVPKSVPGLLFIAPNQDGEHKRGYITMDAIMAQHPMQFATEDGWRNDLIDRIKKHVRMGKHSLQPALPTLIQRLQSTANKQHEEDYSERLLDSATALKNHQCMEYVIPDFGQIASSAEDYRSEILKRLKARLEQANAAAHEVASSDSTFSEIVKYTDIFPRISLSLFLQLLSFSNRSTTTDQWLPLLKQIAVLCRDLLHVDRILRACKNKRDVLSEIKTIDRYNYEDSAFSDATLFEISNDICVRANQLEIMHQMKDPPNGENSVMQLNMGEGKSSVIIPILSASLARGSELVRVFVGKHQSMQMIDTMTAAMGGLINRPVFYMPFNRESRLNNSEIGKLQLAFVRCAKAGGVLLLQPEHHLSLLLSTCLNEDVRDTKNYIGLLKYINSNSRDIIDECDEILSPTYELIYTIGNSGPVDFAPDRWTILQSILGLVVDYSNPKAGVVTEKEVIFQSRMNRSDAYPTIRFLTLDGLKKVLTGVARKFVCDGITGLPIGRYSGTEKSAILKFVTEKKPKAKYVKKVERFGSAAKSAIALVRGCITGDLIRAALVQKRFRVGYGHDFVRSPSTRLAVPFAAKDVPKPRSEFSNVDIVILFTQLSYYHSGLREQDVRELVKYVSSTDDGREVYKSWFNERSKMPNSLTALASVNLQDDRQFHNDFFPNITHSMKAINYFLSRIVFPRELGAFSQHMSASGWDLGVEKHYPTTGFSGTTD